MNNVADLPGASHLIMVPGVLALDPHAHVFRGMLEGWTLQQRSRFLKPETIASRVALIRRFADFTNQYPWDWQPADVEAFIESRRNGQRPIVVSTARLYQHGLRIFMDYVTDSRYGWSTTCVDRFGTAPAQILHDFNSVVHVDEWEAKPGRRPLTYDEVQALFDAADARAGQIQALHRKGSLTAMRDAALLKAIYAFGLRRREAWGLDLADLRYNPKVPGFGRFGALFVRWGKSSRGGTPKRRTVLTVPEMDWIVPVLDQWLTEVRPALGPGKNAGLWVSERSARLSLRSINEAFTISRDAAGLPGELDLHCLRHSYVTHLVEFDYPEKFVQDQVGHTYASTTAIYTGVSDEYRNRLLQQSLRRYPDLWEEKVDD